jgi:hypothetical protein
VASVTSPVSCGRGLTSENQTWSPLMNSSTPKMPRPPRLPVTAPAMSRDFLQCHRRHGHRLPGLDVIAVHLDVADRLAEEGLHGSGGADGSHRELGDFVVEVDEALDDDAPGAYPSRGLRIVPGLLHVGLGPDQRLALARGGHHRLDDAREAYAAVDRGLQFCQRVGELVGRGGEAEFLGGQPPDAFAVHGQLRRARGGDHLGEALLFDFDQHRGGDGLDLGHHQLGLFLLDQGAQRGAVGHGHDMAAMRHLHARRIGIAVHADHLAAEALQCDNYLLAQFAAAEQHHAGGGWRKWSADMFDDGHQVLPKKL